MATRLRDKVVVITGASSGIGKATALELARDGARLALGARRQPELEDTVAACRKAGAEVVSVPTDVADEAQVQTLARTAVEAFGRIDVWFNNAGIDAFGTFLDIPAASFERVLQVNFMGTVYGSRAAVTQFREQGSGVLINNASIVGICPTPFHSPYVASKFAIRGFSHALRQELIGLPDVHVCTICPSSIDTPLWQRGGNYSGRKVKPLDPVHPVEQVAGVVLALILAPQREVFAGATGWVLSEQHAADPELTEAFAASFARASLFQDVASDPTDGVLFTPETGNGGVSGGWMDPTRPGIAAGDLPAMFAAPALLAGGPALYSWKLSRKFVQQFGMQLATFTAFHAWTGTGTKTNAEG
ncbi:SDR family NAD(P)-dependent oxidoreductase [Methylorubrum extorquens]